jgi:L-ascorbate metabolism protein UlaG (beta-lactamase superfamily)
MPTNPYYSGPPSDHFDGLRFFAPGAVADKTPADMLRWAVGGGRAKWPTSAPSPFEDTPPARVEGDALRIVFLGHAGFLIQTQGLNLLIDPVYARRASPYSWIGPARVNAPGVALDRLPPIDAVLISHNHYDHLDLSTLRALHGAHRPRVITPLGNDAIMRSADPAIRVEALDWGMSVTLGAVTIHLEPTYHWSARGLGDRRMALWGAFVIAGPGGVIYAIGDTALRDGAPFAAIKEKYGAPRVALIPIGAYEPRWFMRDQHINPEESVAVLRLCGARRAIAHHWGTFQLTNEAIDAPPLALARALQTAGLSPERFRVMRPGEVDSESAAAS